MRRPVIVLVLLSLLAVTAASCGGGGGKGEEAEVRPRRGGVLRVGVVGPEGEPAAERLQSLDPAQARSLSELLAAEQLFESLTSYDPATLDVRPGLAAGWEVTPDQLHWSFTLRPGITFTNGRPITSADVQYTLERIARKGSTSPAAVQLEVVGGFRAFNVDGTAANLAGVSAPAPNVVRIDLDQPLSSLPAVLGSAVFGIVPREAVEAQPPAPPFAERPVGSGQFHVRGRDRNAVQLRRTPGSGALLTGVDLVLHRNQTAAYDAFVRGELDWSPVPLSRVDETKRAKGRLVAKPYLAELFYGFNLKNLKFFEPRFREAITRAIDRDAIVRDVYSSTVRPVNGLVPQGTPGHQPDPCGEKCRYDPAKAKELVAAAFGSSPPQVAIDYDEDPTQAMIAKEMQADLSAVGIPAIVRPHPPGEYLKFAVSGQQELFRLGWIGAYPSADAFLAPLFVSGLPDNVTGLTVPEIDQLLKGARAEPSEARRTELYRQAERKIMEQLPIIPIAQFDTRAVVGSRVRGLVVTATGTFDASRVWLAAASPPR
jgi:oligopeptide transport system substrate-binding protein